MLSKRERDTYEFIQGFIARRGQGPLLTEIAAGLNIHSKGTVHRYVQAIANEGFIKLVPGRHRGICLAKQRRRAASKTLTQNTCLPLLGRIAAGQPIEAIPDQDEVNLAEFFMGPNRFVLKVQGDSMIDAGILDGDMVIIKSRDYADNNDIVVALIDNEEATLKRIQYNRDGSITLCPENRALLPRIYTAEQIRIQGVVVGQMRCYD